MAKKKKPIDEDIIIISKSEQKRDHHELQDLAEVLANFNVNQRSTLPLDEELLAALRLADKIRGKHDAYARNLRFVAKQIGTLDVEAIKFGIEKIKNRHTIAAFQSSKIEELRDNLIADASQIEPLLSEHEALERQKLRQLVRNASKEVKAEKPAKSYKELFKYLKECISFE